MTIANRFRLLNLGACAITCVLLRLTGGGWWLVAAQYSFLLGLLLGRFVVPYQ